MKKLLLLSIVLLGLNVSFANSKTEESVTPASTENLCIQGNVTDINSGEALAGVKIEIEGTKEVVYTDFEGNFSIVKLKAGNYDLNVSYISYNEVAFEDIKLENSQVSLKLKLTKS